MEQLGILAWGLAHLHPGEGRVGVERVAEEAAARTQQVGLQAGTILLQLQGQRARCLAWHGWRRCTRWWWELLFLHAWCGWQRRACVLVADDWGSFDTHAGNLRWPPAQPSPPQLDVLTFKGPPMLPAYACLCQHLHLPPSEAPLPRCRPSSHRASRTAAHLRSPDPRPLTPLPHY